MQIMKKNAYVVAVFIFISALLWAFVGCQSKPATTTTTKPIEVAKPVETEKPMEVGEVVCFPWSGGVYALASVEEIKDGKVKGKFLDDNSVLEAKKEEVVRIKKKVWKVGDKVHAVYSEKSGRFDPGVINEVKENEIYMVKWDDGTSPSEVKGKLIVEYIQPKDKKEEVKKDEAKKVDTEKKVK